MNTKPLAVVTGASTGIGFELARVCAQNNFDLIVAANEPQIDVAATNFEALGAAVVPVQGIWRHPPEWTNWLQR